MFYFGVPLRARESSRDWCQVSERFSRTLHSLSRQTDPNFTVLVACHQIPDLEGGVDPHVQFIEARSEPPQPEDYRGQMVDKGRKVHLILSHIKRLGAGPYMQVDADDLVNRHIVEFTARRVEIAGWNGRLGLVYRVGSGFVQLNPFMNRHCGTTCIVRLQDGDLPQDMSDADSPEVASKYVLRRAHHAWRDGFAAAGRRFRTLPFPGCVYVTGYSDNHSLNKPNVERQSWPSLRQLTLSMSPRITISDRFIKDFGFQPELRSRS